MNWNTISGFALAAIILLVIAIISGGLFGKLFVKFRKNDFSDSGFFTGVFIAWAILVYFFFFH